MKNQIRLLIFSVAVMLSYFIHGCSTKEKSAETPKKPNIIFYLADDQDVYDYGCYGNVVYNKKLNK